MNPVEVYRIDAYSGCRDVKRLKLLKEEYEFWEMAAPIQYRESWALTKSYCIQVLSTHGVK